tara:strand:- start:1227 stop:1496 length:270 start_codon:yes stop_codon:yes gene_type:complete
MEQVMDGRIERKLRSQDAITKKYGKPYTEVIRLMYEYHDNLDDVASELGITKPKIYRWCGKDTVSQWKKQNREALVAYLTNPAREILDD